MKTLTQHILFSCIGILLFIVAVLGINTYRDFSNLADSLKPVVTEVVAIDKISTVDYLDLRVFATRARHCGGPIAKSASYDDNTYESFQFLDDINKYGLIKIPDEQKANTKGKLNLGWWRFTPNSFDTPIKVKIFHDCDGVIVTTEFTLYPADIKRNNK